MENLIYQIMELENECGRFLSESQLSEEQKISISENCSLLVDFLLNIKNKLYVLNEDDEIMFNNIKKNLLEQMNDYSKYQILGHHDIVNEEYVKTKEICSICQCEFELNDSVVILACGHTFHDCCMDNWIDKVRENPRCPLCKYCI